MLPVHASGFLRAMRRSSTAGVGEAASFSAASAGEALLPGSLTKRPQHAGGPNNLLFQPLLLLLASVGLASTFPDTAIML